MKGIQPPMSEFAEFQNELDKMSIEQLHKAVLQLGGNCFETKKLCATVLISAGTLMVALLERRLDPSLFVGGMTVLAVFWLVDAQSYYYQEKLRARMKKLAENLAVRGAHKLEIEGVGMPLTDEREDWKPLRRAGHALVNSSMLFYLVVALVLLFVLQLYEHGAIQTVATSRS